MTKFKNKNILLISPQAWGKMFISKHHYAVELAKLGNTVYFLNPPDKILKERVLITAILETPGLFIINHRINFPYNIKFHSIMLFHWLIQWQIKKILNTIGEPIDIVWSFDLGNLYPFKLFPKTALRIFHPVDEPLNDAAINSAKDAQVIFSVTHEILEKYTGFVVPAHFVNHGVSELFLHCENLVSPGDSTRVGFAGNLLRTDIDRPVLLQIIHENPDVIFEFLGSYQENDSNIGGGLNSETTLFLKSLRSYSNVVLHGVVKPEELAAAYQHIDAFLICYDIEKDQSKGTNYHKVMEFISTGKVIISNNISTYKGMPHLVTMVEERDNNRMLPALFKKTILSLVENNSGLAMDRRKKYAREHSYQKQLEKIVDLL